MSTNQTPPKVISFNGKTELSKEEKLRKRQERLAAFRLQKEKEKSGQASSDLKLPISKTPSHVEEDEKKRKLQQKVEEWKRKRQQAAQEPKNSVNTTATKSITNTSNTNKPIVTLKPRKRNVQRSVQKRRPLAAFESEEPETTTIKFRAPYLAVTTDETSVAKDESGYDDSVDELDAYIQDLAKKESAYSSMGHLYTENVPFRQYHDNNIGYQDANDSDDNYDEDEEQQKLLSDKFMKLQNKQKDLEHIDHSLVEYKSFRKDFYKEPRELSDLSELDVEIMKLEQSNIKTRGHHVPRPVSKWSQLGLSSVIMDVIQEKLGYDNPTPIQSQALPSIMSGRDVIGIAKTGSGKTLSFVLPMIRHIQDQDRLSKGDGPIGLILTPTRELALQIYRESNNFTKKLSLSVACCYGGSSIEPQIAELKKGVEILVGTPGRIIDLLAANNGKVTNLHRVTYLVVDEADRMFDSGFEPQVLKIFSQIRPDRQTILFSATFPKSMELLAKRNLENPIQIIIDGVSVVAPEITQKVEFFDENDENDLTVRKFDRLLLIMNENVRRDSNAKILIFVDKQAAADELLVKLLSNGFPSLTIHGGKDQVDRKHAIKEFSSPQGQINILIATSIAARGLDVKNLKLVINYEPANHLEDYVHRVGRTGRAGNKGTAITFVSYNETKAIADLVKAMTLSHVQEDHIPKRVLEISKNFMDKVKSGKDKLSFGFGGKGLGNLQDSRQSKLELQRKSFEHDMIEQNVPVNDIANEERANQGTPPLEGKYAESLPDFQIIEGRAPETSGPDKSKFHSRITVNDLPQKARWVVVNGDNLAKIIETTSTSITNKGQFYPPNTKVPKTSGKNKELVPPKLYLLVEGLTEASVKQANNLIRQKMIEGLELAAKEQSKTPVGKYTV